MLLKKRGKKKQVAGFLLAQGSGGQATDYIAEGDVPTIYGLEEMVANILNIIIGLAGVVLLLMLIGGGFGYITSGGDKEKAAKAKNTLTYAILGLVVILGAWLIIRLIEEFTGLNLHIFQIPKK
jgi:cytochrome bd-type quinol oxidase subunit 2